MILKVRKKYSFTALIKIKKYSFIAMIKYRNKEILFYGTKKRSNL